MIRSLSTNRRLAFTLTELMITLSLGSGMMLIAVSLVHRSMHLTSAARGRADEHRAIGRLVDSFRRDVHQAETASIEDSGRLLLSIPSVGDVVYEVQPAHCLRTLLAVDKPVHRESFTLQPGALIELEIDDTPTRVVLTIGRGDRWSRTELDDSRPRSPSPYRKPAAVRVEAVVGMLHSRVEAMTNLHFDLAEEFDR